MALDALNLEGRMDAVLREHEKVLQALRRKDLQGARKALDGHLVASHRAVLEGRQLREKERVISH
jgi:DNA-binding GntR family transcriptional regulator